MLEDTQALDAGTLAYNAGVLALRRYRPEDFDRLMEIDHACFVEGIAYPREEMQHYLARRTSITLVAAEGGRILGFVVSDRYRSRRAPHSIGHIVTIDVAPETQKSGVGSLLLTGVEEELKKAECGYVSLEVAVDNQKAIGFYKKHGYSVLKALPRYYLDSIDALLMGKRL